MVSGVQRLQRDLLSASNSATDLCKNQTTTHSLMKAASTQRVPIHQNRVQERQDLWDAWAPSPADALQIFREMAKEDQRAARLVALEEVEIGPAPYIQEGALVW